VAIDLKLANVPGRTCEGCTKCCEGSLTGKISDTITISPGVPCALVELGKGCTAYDERPVHPCKQFKCLWLVEKLVPESLKPSESNIILVIEEVKKMRYLAAVEAGARLDSEYLSWLIIFAFNNNLNFCWQVDGRWFWNGSVDFVEEMAKKYV
jgi:hypothetical protein